MARIRSIKPEFFLHDGLAELPALHRLFFIGLWTQADRGGRLTDHPKRLRITILPYDDVDADQILTDLAQHEERFITRYQGDGERLIQINGFGKHQLPHIKEAASTLPPPSEHDTSTVPAPCGHPTSTPVSGKGAVNRSGHRKGAVSAQQVAPTPPGFDLFWSEYPNRRDKKRAKAIWCAKHLDAKAVDIVAAVRAQKLWPQWQEGVIPHPTTWLNGERWEDEAPPPRAPPQVPLNQTARERTLAYLGDRIREEGEGEDDQQTSITGGGNLLDGPIPAGALAATNKRIVRSGDS